MIHKNNDIVSFKAGVAKATLLLLFSHQVVSDPLSPCGLQHARRPCPSPTPRVRLNSCPLSRWCHPTVSSSVTPFSSCLQSFPALGSLPMSQLFPSGGQSIAASSSVSVLPRNIQGWFPLGLTSLISLQSKRILKSLLQHHNLKASILLYGEGQKAKYQEFLDQTPACHRAGGSRPWESGLLLCGLPRRIALKPSLGHMGLMEAGTYHIPLSKLWDERECGQSSEMIGSGMCMCPNQGPLLWLFLLEMMGKSCLFCKPETAWAMLAALWGSWSEGRKTTKAWTVEVRGREGMEKQKWGVDWGGWAGVRKKTEKETERKSWSSLCLLGIVPFHGLVTGPNASPGSLHVPCFIDSKMPLILSCTII